MTTLATAPEPERDGAGNPIPRDGRGRYLLPDPHTGDQRSWTRATTFIDAYADKYHVQLWEKRLVAHAFATNPGLVDNWQALEDPLGESKATANALVEQAKTLVGAHERAELGTRLHGYVEALARNERPLVNPGDRARLQAYVDALAAAGIQIAANATERVVVNTDYDCAGTVDSWLTHNGQLYVGDLKTGSSLDWSTHKYAQQLHIYQSAQHLWNGDTYDPAPDSHPDWGILIWLPADADPPICELRWVDLRLGARANRIAAEVRAIRGRKDYLHPFTSTPPDHPPVGRAGQAPSPKAPPPAEGDGAEHAPPADNGRRLTILTACRRLDPEKQQKMKDRWPTDVPSLIDVNKITDYHLDRIADLLDELTGTRVGDLEMRILNARLEDLPSDLVEDIRKQAAIRGILHLEIGVPAEDYDWLLDRCDEADKEATVRWQQRKVAGVTDAFNDRMLDALGHEKLLAALTFDDGNDYGKRELLNAGRYMADRHGLTKPKKADDVKADGALYELAVWHLNNQKQATTSKEDNQQ